MRKLPDIVEQFLKCRINACDEHETSFSSFNKINYIREVVKDSFLDDITTYYKSRGYQASQRLYNLLIEPLKGMNFKVPHKHSIEFSLILSPRALTASYFDGQSYIMQDTLRKKWGAKLDLIYVDTNIGKLYLGISVSNRHFFS